jgi:hypothetical protein
MNWDIKGCSGKCIKCSKLLEDNESFNCVLFLEKDGPVREDYCINCWDASSDEKKGYSNWQGRYRIEPQKIEIEPVKGSALKELLKKWLNSADRLHQCFCYVLVIMLEREKSFSEKPKIKSPEGKEQLVYEDKETGELYILEDPSLTLKELSEVEVQLQELIKQELYKA